MSVRSSLRTGMQNAAITMEGLVLVKVEVINRHDNTESVALLAKAASEESTFGKAFEKAANTFDTAVNIFGLAALVAAFAMAAIAGAVVAREWREWRDQAPPTLAPQPRPPNPVPAAA
jgi:hypothetical protein